MRTCCSCWMQTGPYSPWLIGCIRMELYLPGHHDSRQVHGCCCEDGVHSPGNTLNSCNDCYQRDQFASQFWYEASHPRLRHLPTVHAHPCFAGAGGHAHIPILPRPSVPAPYDRTILPWCRPTALPCSKPSDAQRVCSLLFPLCCWCGGVADGSSGLLVVCRNGRTICRATRRSCVAPGKKTTIANMVTNAR
jgi:hypothetical protein